MRSSYVRGTCPGNGWHRTWPGIPRRLWGRGRSEPESLKGALWGVVAGSRILFGLASVELSATSEVSRRVFIVDGSPVRAGPPYGWAEEFSILRGKLVIGVLRAYPAGRGPLAVEHREGLHAEAAVVGLTHHAAHARELTPSGPQWERGTDRLGGVRHNTNSQVSQPRHMSHRHHR